MLQIALSSVLSVADLVAVVRVRVVVDPVVQVVLERTVTYAEPSAQEDVVHLVHRLVEVILALAVVDLLVHHLVVLSVQ